MIQRQRSDRKPIDLLNSTDLRKALEYLDDASSNSLRGYSFKTSLISFAILKLRVYVM